MATCDWNKLLKDAGCLGSCYSNGQELAIIAQLLCNASNQDFPEKLSLGLVSGAQLVSIVGHNPDVDTGSVPEDIWEGSDLYPFQTSAQALEIVSDSADDAAAGTGMRTVFVQGLNASYEPISETVSLNGLTAVPLVNSYLRVNSTTGATAGSGGTNAGTVTLRLAGGGATANVIGLGDGKAHSAIYTVPAGKTLLMSTFLAQILRQGAANYAEMTLFIRTFGGPWVSRQLFSLVSQATSSLQARPGYPIPVTEKADIRFTVVDVSANNTDLTATIVGALFDNAP